MSWIARKGDRIGKYVLMEPLGCGGNGVVWRATFAKGECAIKILKKVNAPKAYERFKREIRALVALREQSGILPIIDFSLPNTDVHRRPWYSMPIAKPVLERTRETVSNVTEGIIEIAIVLDRLHSQGIHHRDIKPSNMYRYDGSWVLSDFGLVEMPDDDTLTSPREQVGARWTVAPEMKRDPLHADGAKADVYSLAKTYWILLTGIGPGFEGRYDPLDSTMGLRFLIRNEFWLTIDDLLARSTSNSPADRPNVREFAESLTDWLTIHKNFLTTNTAEWKYVQRRLFPLIIPERAEWKDIDSIIEIFNFLGGTKALNHLFLPSGGGLDLSGARKSVEYDCIELNLQGLAYVLRPERLLFEGFKSDPSWNYFRLEAQDLKPSEVYEDLRWNHEEVTEIEPGVYIDRAASDSGENEGRRLPRAARVVSRYFKGSFVIFSKTSIYNMASETYDARHDKMDADRFRAYIERHIKP